MQALVTGATGLVGGAIVEALLCEGHQVKALARRSADTVHVESCGATIVYGDLEDYGSLAHAARGADTVFHAAGRVTPGWGSWEEFEQLTVAGTEKLLGASEEAGVSRFLYVSSASVYGKLCAGGVPVDESAPCEVAFSPDSYYEYAKLKAEELVLACHARGALEVTIIRPGMIYGPRDRLASDRVYRHMAPRIILWPGRANPRCVPVFASDVAECAVLAASRPEAAGEIYNVTPPGEVRLREFCAWMVKAQGGARLEITIPYWVCYGWCAAAEFFARMRRSKEMPYLTRAAIRFLNQGVYHDGSKVKRELGWEPKVSMEEGTRLYVQWRRRQEDGRANPAGSQAPVHRSGEPEGRP